jgi:TonB family protein
MKLTTALLVGLILAICSDIARGQQTREWLRYNAEDFSVLLPDLPTTIEVARPKKMFEKQLTARQFSAYEDSVVYVILAFDNPSGRHPLSRFVNEISKYSISAKAETFERDISGAGFTGQQYSFSYGSELNGVLRFYLTKEDVYVLEAIGVDVTKPSVNRFLDSFAIGRSQADKTASVVDRPDIAKPDDQVFRGKELTVRARVVVKPEPRYTEEARQNAITGTVVLTAVLSSSGRVTDLHPMRTLPFGLTERALEAARNIRFIPGQKDGRHASQYVQLEYGFNLY